MKSFVADRGDARLRLDQVIVRRLWDVPRLSRTRVQRWIADRLVLVNDHPASRAAAVVTAGDRISVIADEALDTRTPPAAERLPLDILYEDEHMLALNKPAGMVAHPGYKNPAGTLLNAVLAYVSTASLVHRLDKQTSGVLLAAKSPAMHARLQRALSHRQTRKEYLAIVAGRPRPARGVIALPLGRDGGDRRRVTVRDDGRPSETRYEVIGADRRLSLVRCQLGTGRMHQIRVHLAAMGWPVVGDMTYGQPSALIGRQALHAWRVTFRHPESGRTTEILAPPPPDLAGLIQNFTL